LRKGGIAQGCKGTHARGSLGVAPPGGGWSTAGARWFRWPRGGADDDEEKDEAEDQGEGQETEEGRKEIERACTGDAEEIGAERVENDIGRQCSEFEEHIRAFDRIFADHLCELKHAQHQEVLKQRFDRRRLESAIRKRGGGDDDGGFPIVGSGSDLGCACVCVS
jgi:hypothetical protein